jgi:hypothetical protein
MECGFLLKLAPVRLREDIEVLLSRRQFRRGR